MHWPDRMRDGGLGKLHKKMRRFGDTVSRATRLKDLYEALLARLLEIFELGMC